MVFEPAAATRLYAAYGRTGIVLLLFLLSIRRQCKRGINGVRTTRLPHTNRMKDGVGPRRARRSPDGDLLTL
jgi:hypothetical protein